MTIPAAELSKVRQYITQVLVASSSDLGATRAERLMALQAEVSPVPVVAGAMEILYEYVQAEESPSPGVIAFLAAFADIVRDGPFMGKGDRAGLVARVARAKLGTGTLPEPMPDIETQAPPTVAPLGPPAPPPAL
jgi:hypothetical protein